MVAANNFAFVYSSVLTLKFKQLIKFFLDLLICMFCCASRQTTHESNIYSFVYQKHCTIQ